MSRVFILPTISSTTHLRPPIRLRKNTRRCKHLHRIASSGGNVDRRERGNRRHAQAKRETRVTEDHESCQALTHGPTLRPHLWPHLRPHLTNKSRPSRTDTGHLKGLGRKCIVGGQKQWKKDSFLDIVKKRYTP